MRKITIAFTLFAISVLLFTAVVHKIKVDSASHPIFLINSVNNFDNLQINDLPNPSDYRGVFKYHQNYIIVGLDKVVEYNPVKKEVVRQSNDAIGVVVDGVIVGDDMFVVAEKPHEYRRNVYQVSLKTGKVVKRILPDNEYINVDIATSGNKIWISYNGGGVSYEPSNSKYNFYSYLQMGFDRSTCPNSVTFHENFLKMLCNSVASSYQSDNDSWKATTETNKDYHLWDFDLKGFGVDFKLPRYQSLIKINDYYLIVADDGVYKLSRDGFPILFKTINKLNLADTITNIVISPDHTKILLIGINHGLGESSIDIDYQVGLIDLTSGEYLNFFQDQKLVSRLDRIGANVVMSKISSASVNFGDQIVRFDDPVTGTMFAEYKFASHQFTWY